MPEQLLKAVQDLNDSVRDLETTLHDYPKRKEVEARFATKTDQEQKRKRALLLGLVMLLIGLAASYLVTVSTISTCFISDSARAGEAGFACNMLPGYSEAQKENEKLLKQVKVLLRQPKINEARLDRIEKKLGLPPLPQEGKNDE